MCHGALRGPVKAAGFCLEGPAWRPRAWCRQLCVAVPALHTQSQRPAACFLRAGVPEAHLPVSLRSQGPFVTASPQFHVGRSPPAPHSPCGPGSWAQRRRASQPGSPRAGGRACTGWVSASAKLFVGFTQCWAGRELHHLRVFPRARWPWRPEEVIVQGGRKPHPRKPGRWHVAVA